jgi:hypothetical protein
MEKKYVVVQYLFYSDSHVQNRARFVSQIKMLLYYTYIRVNYIDKNNC